MKVRARIAYLWTPTGVTAVLVEVEWPAALVRNGWVYSPDLAIDDSIIVRRGGWSGAEVVHYRMRRRVRCDDHGWADDLVTDGTAVTHGE